MRSILSPSSVGYADHLPQSRVAQVEPPLQPGEGRRDVVHDAQAQQGRERQDHLLQRRVAEFERVRNHPSVGFMLSSTL